MLALNPIVPEAKRAFTYSGVRETLRHATQNTQGIKDFFLSGLSKCPKYKGKNQGTHDILFISHYVYWI